VKRLAVLGHPVSHSRSPAMQNAALRQLGLANEWSYEALDITPEDFELRTRKLPGRGFVGANVTIPHKEAALTVAGEASEAATEIGAANTLSFGEGGIRAENTDAPGLLAALSESPSGRRALVLGAGGSARAAAWALAGAGARVDVWNRTGERAKRLVRDLAPAGESERRIAAIRADQVGAGDHGLILNCTAVGLAGEEPFGRLPIEPDWLDADVTVVDLVYGGEETALIREARGRGAAVVDGLEVLVRQGAESLRIWTGLEPPLEVMREGARAG
jgi:shikimate dehydrogenase